ncbi:MAG: acyltransferase [Gammaproteobacteria bacterium]|nr:acyltransferase [Gammaproteobacteria bacterium]
MFRFLPGPIKAPFAFSLHTVNTLFWALPIFLLALLKLALPIPPLTRALSRALNFCATSWISVNSLVHGLTLDLDWRVEGLEDLKSDDWYLVVANHQSWTDIFVLQKVFNRKIPFLKFFLKQELLYVPVLGLAWWALDFPFMKRHSKDYLKKNPHMKGKDAETTRKACEKFRHIPISVMNFVEGTRFTPAKKAQQASPFQRLLKPKAGGAGMVLSAMGGQLHRMLDVTIAYPEGAPSFWEFLSGKIRRVHVHVRSLPIAADMLGDYESDKEYRARFQTWLNGIWQEKDARLADMLKRD